MANPVAAQRPAPALPGAFWRLFVSTASSNLGDGIGRTAFPLLAATLTRDPVAVSLLSAAFFAPWLVLAVPSGALIDRVDRTRAMALANLARAIVVLGLAVAVFAGVATIAWLYAAALLLGAAETVADNAYRAMLPAVVAPEQLDRGNGYLQGAELVSDAFLGAPIASVSFAAATASPFVGSAAGFALSAAVAGRLPPTKPERDESLGSGVQSLRSELAEGVTWLVRHPLLRSIAVVSAVMGFVGAGYSAILVLYVLDVLHVPAALFGPFIVALAVGGVIGSVTAGPVTSRIGRAQALRLSIWLCGATLLALGLTTNALIAIVLFALSSWTVLLWNVISMSLRQQLIPAHLFGRVQGAWRTLVYGVMPLGAVVGGWLASGFGLAAPFAIAGAVHFVLVVAAWRLLDEATRRT